MKVSFLQTHSFRLLDRPFFLGGAARVFDFTNIPQTHSFRRFVRPTFLEGAARVFDFTNILQRYRYDSTDDEADRNALRSDWMAVGDDIRHAIDQTIGIYER